MSYSAPVEGDSSPATPTGGGGGGAAGGGSAPASSASVKAAALRGPLNTRVTAVFTLTNPSLTAAVRFPRYFVPEGATVEVSPLGSNTNTVAIGANPAAAVSGPREIYAQGAVPRNYYVADVAEIGWLIPAVVNEGVMIRVLSGGA